MATVLRIIEGAAALVAVVYFIFGFIAAVKARRRLWIPVIMCVLLPISAEAACDSTTVQNQINAASSGDTVTITPANCTATWNTLVTKGSTKGLTIDFNGAVITCGTPCNSNNSPIFSITTNATTADRVTNVEFTTTNGSAGLEVFMEIDTTAGHPRFRLDHCTFDGDNMGIHLRVGGPGYGLIDHCTFLWSGNNEVIQHVAYGSGSHSGWVLDVTPGSLDALYVEDSTFTNTISGNFLGGKTLSAYGAKIVYRFNTLNCMEIDVHGTAGSVGGRYWELYHNTSNAQPNCNNVDKWYQIRAGTGFIFNNTFGTGTNNGGGDIVLWEEDSGTYPLLFQVGRGKCSANPCTQGSSSNMALDPAYLWGNETPPMNVGVDEVTGSTIVIDRDYYTDTGGGVGVGTIASRPSTCTVAEAYWATDEGEWWADNAGADGRLYKCTATNTWTLYYTPATYPHELQGGGGGGGGATIVLFLQTWWGELLAGVGVLWKVRQPILFSILAVVGFVNTMSATSIPYIQKTAYTTKQTLANAVLSLVQKGK